MTFNLQPSARLNGLVLAGLLAAMGTIAMAQGTPPASPSPGPRSEHMGHHDPAKMQAMMAKQQGELKVKLGITPAQEAAWSSYTTAMQPPAQWKRGDRQAQQAEFEKLPTPERINKMRAMRDERMAKMNAEMDKRGAAAKSLYAALSAQQQKTFDAERQLHGPARGGKGHLHHGGADIKKD